MFIKPKKERRRRREEYFFIFSVRGSRVAWWRRWRHSQESNKNEEMKFQERKYGSRLILSQYFASSKLECCELWWLVKSWKKRERQRVKCGRKYFSGFREEREMLNFECYSLPSFLCESRKLLQALNRHTSTFLSTLDSSLSLSSINVFATFHQKFPLVLQREKSLKKKIKLFPFFRLVHFSSGEKHFYVKT